ITSGNDHTLRKAPLNIERVLLYTPRTAGRIREAHGVTNLRHQTQRVASRLRIAGREGIGETTDGLRAVGANQNGIGGRRKALSAPCCRVRGVVLLRRIEDSIAAPHHEFAGVPGETGSRTELGGARFSLMRRRTVNAGEDQSALELHADFVADRIPDVRIKAYGKPVLFLLEALLVFVTQPKI